MTASANADYRTPPPGLVTAILVALDGENDDLNASHKVDPKTREDFAFVAALAAVRYALSANDGSVTP